MPEACLNLSLGMMSNILNVGVLVVDDAGSLACATPLACELLGYKDHDEAMVAWPALKSLLALEPDQFEAAAKPVRLSRRVKTQQIQRTLRIEVHPLGPSTCPGLLVMIRDKQALDGLDINLLAASRMRTQEYLYGALSHDMKIPLNAMQITLELLADTLADISAGVRDETAVRGERHVAALREEFLRLRSALDTTAGLSKPPATLRRHSFDLRDVVLEVVKLLQSQARRQDVTVDAQLPQAAVIMSAPEDWIKQVLLNIAVSQLEAMDTEGRLSLALESNDRVATLVVAVDAAAMAEELADSAFHVRVPSAAVERASGLNVARAVVESLGGEFLIEREPGTRFRLTLPLR